MRTPPHSEEWRELDRLVDRRFARLSSRFGTCPICGRGATSFAQITTITWGVCEPCQHRWPLGDLMEPEHDEAILQAELYVLADYHQLDHTEIPMTTRVERSPDLDPRSIDSGLLSWSPYPQLRIAIGRCFEAELLAHPLQIIDADRFHADERERWQRLRGQMVNQTTLEEVFKRVNLDPLKQVQEYLAALFNAHRRRLELQAQHDLLDRLFATTHQPTRTGK